MKKEKLLCLLLALCMLLPGTAFAAASPSVTLSGPGSGATSVEVGKTVTLTAAATGITSPTFDWDVRPEGVATLIVNESGRAATLTGLKGGTAIVTVVATGTEGSTRAEHSVSILQPAKSLTLTSPGGLTGTDITAEVAINARISLGTTIVPQDTSKKDIKWTSSAESVATVENGLVTGVSMGTAVITATVDDGSGVSAKCTVTVTKPASTVTLSYVGSDGKTVSGTQIATAMQLGKTIQLTVTVDPSDTTDAISWESSHDMVAQLLTHEDTLTGGKATATFKAVGVTTPLSNALLIVKVGSKTATCKIDVSNVPIDSLALRMDDKDGRVLADGEELGPFDVGDDLTLYAEVLPEEANQRVDWSSTVPTVASVNNGHVVTYSGGETTISAKAADGRSVSCIVKVNSLPIKSITLNRHELKLSVRQTTSPLVFIIDPADAYQETVTWTSDDTSVATVDSDGRVTAVAKGTAVITASVGGKSDTCEVTVSDVPVSILEVLPREGRVIDPAETLRFNATLKPDGALGLVEWSSSDPKVATAAPISLGTGDPTEVNDKTGIVTGVSAGKATVTIVVNKGADDERSTTREIEVSGIVLDESSLTLAIGDTAQVGLTPFGRADGSEKPNWSLKNASDSKYVTVNPGSGLITAKAIGIATVVCSQSGYEAELTVTVTDTSATRIERTIRSGETLEFKDILSEFVDIEYLTGLSVSGDQGTLYYGYASVNNPGTGVASTDKFYKAAGSDPSRKLIERITFVPATGFIGTATIRYTIMPNVGEVKSGNIVVTVKEPSGIFYVSENGEAINFRTDDFETFSKAKYGFSVNSVRFTAPDPRFGFLYANYSAGEVYGSNISNDKWFYATSTPSINTVAFVPKAGYTGTFNIDFELVDRDNKTHTGTAQITVKSASGKGAGDIAYTAYVGDRLYFTPADFQQICTDVGLGTLTYVTFSSGSLPNSPKIGNSYHNTTQISSGNYYAASDGHSREFLGNVNFLPAAVGTVEIPFTLVHYVPSPEEYKTATGKIVITVLENDGRATIINYTSTGMPVGFTRGDFTEACRRSLSGELASVTFDLPSPSVGRLYESFQDLHTNTPLAAGKAISAADIIKMTFVPKGGTEGSVYVSYTAKDARGNSCTGSVRIFVDPNTSSQYFKDASNGSYRWAASSLDFLRKFNVVNGRSDTIYAPAASISRGDFTLMLYRAFDFPNYGTSSFPDVPASSYYATAIAAARAKGIAQGANGLFRPAASISRQDAAVLLYRALQTQGAVSPGYASSLTRFSDSAQVAGYAQEAMAAMVDLGVFKGDGGRLKPTGTLTRAEMAVILHRALT